MTKLVWLVQLIFMCSVKCEETAPVFAGMLNLVVQQIEVIAEKVRYVVCRIDKLLLCKIY